MLSQVPTLLVKLCALACESMVDCRETSARSMLLALMTRALPGANKPTSASVVRTRESERHNSRLRNLSSPASLLARRYSQAHRLFLYLVVAHTTVLPNKLEKVWNISCTFKTGAVPGSGIPRWDLRRAGSLKYQLVQWGLAASCYRKMVLF